MAIAKYCRSETKDQFIRFLLETGRFTNNNGGSHWDSNKLREAVGELERIFSKYSLDFKETIYPHHMVDDSSKKTKRYEILYGLKWDLMNDELTPSIQPTIYSRKRGAKSGPDLGDSIPDRKHISRHSLSVVCATVASRDGV